MFIFLHGFKLCSNAAKATRNVVEAWGKKGSLERTTRWFEKLRSSNLSLAEDLGRSSLVDDDQLRSIIGADSRKTTSEIAEKLKVDFSTISRSFKEIEKIRKLDK